MVNTSFFTSIVHVNKFFVNVCKYCIISFKKFTYMYGITLVYLYHITLVSVLCIYAS